MLSFLLYVDYLVEIVSTKPIYVDPCVDSLVHGCLICSKYVREKNSVLYCG